jgi:spore germination cell wall hydrolase CwlJ-like protein
MSRFVRAASFAAASFVILFGAGYAGPSQAWEVNTVPAIITTTLVTDTPPPLAAPDAPEVPAEAAPVAPEPEKAAAPPVRRTLSELVAEHSSSETLDAQHDCLAGAVYFESKGEPLAGQLTVAEVVLNRARSGRFASTVCGVVKQRGQFSFVRGGRIPAAPRASPAWKKAVAVARIALEDLADGGAPKALFFHARRVSPGWKLKRVAAVGNHIFYR